MQNATADPAVEVIMAFRRVPGETVVQRLHPDPGVKVEVVRGRYTARHSQVWVRLRGAAQAIDATIRHLADSRVAYRIMPA